MAYVTAIIAAAGQGKRMNAGVNKQFLLLDSKPILAHTLDLFEQCNTVRDIIVVSAPGEEKICEDLVSQFEFRKVKEIIVGGQERQHSVARGISKLPLECDIVAVHDGARPLLLPSDLDNVISGALEEYAAVLAVPVKDTIKEVTKDLKVFATPDRLRLWAVQTPQVFKKRIIVDAYERAFKEGFYGTDDAMLVEKCGYMVKVIKGNYSNIKITTPEDLKIAEVLLEGRKKKGASWCGI